MSEVEGTEIIEDEKIEKAPAEELVEIKIVNNKDKPISITKA